MTPEQKSALTYVLGYIDSSEACKPYKWVLHDMLAASSPDNSQQVIADTAKPVNIPVPTVIDQTHLNQAYVTYGFADEAVCKEFIKATQYPRTLYAAPAIDAAPEKSQILKLAAENGRLRAEIEKYQSVCAATYQCIGALDGPVRFLDALSNAANGEPADALGLLPVESPDNSQAAALSAEQEREAFDKWYRECGNPSFWKCWQARAALSAPAHKESK